MKETVIRMDEKDSKECSITENRLLYPIGDKESQQNNASMLSSIHTYKNKTIPNSIPSCQKFSVTIPSPSCKILF
jgi:hypothetical protein